jgi:hypothetical protein
MNRMNNVAVNQTINVVESAASPPALPGDYNQSTQVDAADYVSWRKAVDSTVTAYSGAYGNGNGVIDDADYTVWRAHFGMSLPSQGAEVENQVATLAETSAVAEGAAKSGTRALASLTHKRQIATIDSAFSVLGADRVHRCNILMDKKGLNRQVSRSIGAD